MDVHTQITLVARVHSRALERRRDGYRREEVSVEGVAARPGDESGGENSAVEGGDEC